MASQSRQSKRRPSLGSGRESSGSKRRQVGRWSVAWGKMQPSAPRQWLRAYRVTALSLQLAPGRAAIGMRLALVPVAAACLKAV